MFLLSLRPCDERMFVVMGRRRVTASLCFNVPVRYASVRTEGQDHEQEGTMFLPRWQWSQ